ncbi:MAG: alpha/beta fold hydrolase, partial [gamma proteobacterium symbiont of Bathyaustriella thionipta]|nr:alpha/beta fold hydrolase [gamma proteobacterium symbiont of Bathyaustriella thionipta]
LFEISRLSLPGHGNTDLAPRQIQGWADYCLQQAPEQAIWCGWSLGGQIAMQAALLQPQRVKGLFMLAGTPCFVQKKDWPCAMSEAAFADFCSALMRDTEATLVRFLALQVRGSATATKVLKQLQQDLKGQPLPTDQALHNGLELLHSVDLRPQLSQLGCPVQWLLAERDSLIPVCLADALPRLLGDIKISHIEKAGHAPFLSHPQPVAQSLQAFCRAQYD